MTPQFVGGVWPIGTQISDPASKWLLREALPLRLPWRAGSCDFPGNLHSFGVWLRQDAAQRVAAGNGAALRREQARADSSPAGQARSQRDELAMVPTMMAHAGAVTDLAELPLCVLTATRGRPNRLAHPANGPCRIVQQRHPPGGRRRQPRIAARQPIRRGRSRSGHRPSHRCRQDLAQHWLYPDYFGSAVARNRGATADVDRGHRYGAPRAKLSRRRRSGGGCVAADTTMSAIARHLGVGWDTCWAAVNTAAQARIADPDRVQGVKAIGVDEHVWRPSRTSAIEMGRI